MAPTPPEAPTAPGEAAEQPIPELLRLGEQLAQARTTAGISEADLAQRLRLAPQQLKALEEGDHTRLPEGVFVVALARRIAGALQVDLEDAIQAVRQSRLMRRPAPAPPPLATVRPDPAPLAPVAAEPKEAVVPSRWPLAALAALAALVAAGGLAATWLLFPKPSPSGVSTTPRRPTPLSTPPPASSPAPPAPADSASLRLNASEPSWVEVREVNGRQLFEGTLTGEKRFPVGRGIEVIAGRPHAVRASIGAAAGAPLGGVADIRWKRFSPAGLPSDSPASAAPSP